MGKKMTYTVCEKHRKKVVHVCVRGKECMREERVRKNKFITAQVILT